MRWLRRCGRGSRELEHKPDFDEDLYEKLKAIAADARKHMKEPWLSLEHGDLLYDERGLPK